MTFIIQSESEVEKGWPKVGKHIGLLIDESVVGDKEKAMETHSLSLELYRHFETMYCGWRILKSI